MNVCIVSAEISDFHLLTNQNMNNISQKIQMTPQHKNVNSSKPNTNNTVTNSIIVSATTLEKNNKISIYIIKA